MKIIIANKFYYIEGGPERYIFGLSDYLASLGHEIIPFAVGYEMNFPTPYAEYFPKPAGSGHTKLDKLEGGMKTKLKIAARSVYSYEARDSLENLIRDTKPDLLYCLNIANHLSPSIIDAGKEFDLPVVMRVSDFYLTCPSYLYLRDGKICIECEGRGYYHALKHKCVYGSMAATLTRVIGMYIHHLLRIYSKADAFITPAQFTKERLVSAGFPADKIHHIPTFIDSSKWIPNYDNEGYILYMGRLSLEKGVEFLLRSYVESGIEDPLYAVGGYSEDYLSSICKDIGESKLKNVSFLGWKSGDELNELVRGAKYVVAPSLCYDNSPNVVYEAFAAGKPVIGSALGGILEQISPETGILVEPGNVEELSKAMRRLSCDPELVKTMGLAARRYAEKEHSVESHAQSLLSLFEKVMEKQ